MVQMFCTFEGWQSGQKMDQQLDKNTVFRLGFWQKNLQIASPPSLFDCSTWKFAQRYKNKCKKFDGSKFLNFSFLHYHSIKTGEWWFSLLLELWRAINSQKSKNSKKGSHQVFGEVSMWKCSSKMIKWSRRPLAFWRLCFINFGQNTVSLVYFSLKQLTCKCL